MAGVTSNYINHLTSTYANRYDYTKMKTTLNSTPLVYGSRSQQNSYVNDSAMQYVNSIRSGAKSLYDSVGLMSQKSTFERMSAVSSNNESLKVNASSNPTKDFTDTTVDIQQVATTQINKGVAMKSDDTYAGLGTQRFEIEVDGKSHQLSVKVELGDTNRQVQQKMADVINSKNLGVTASVAIDTKSKSTTLSVESKNTGDDAKNNFKIRDLSGSLAANTGVNAVSQQAQDAVYSVNGVEKTSKSNTVDLGNGVSATLRKATTESSVNVSIQNDKSYAIGQAKDLVSAYNSLLSAARSGTNGSTRLLNDLTSAYQSYAPALERIGVTEGKDGNLSIDTKKLEAAAENGKLQDFFTQGAGQSYGFTNRLSRIAGNAQSNPSYYINSAQSTKTYTPVDPYDYDTNNIMDLVGSKSFNLKTYNQWYSLGYLFDLFV